MPISEQDRTAVQPNTFGNLLRHYRRVARLSQRELAEQAHLNQDTIRLLERGLTRAPRQDTLALLVTTLGLTPAEQAQLEAAARQQRVISPAPPSETMIPIPLTPLVGREPEIAAILQLLDQDAVRLLTLTGPAGVGKTRLSLHIASALAAHPGRQIAFVDLTAVRDADQVLLTLAQTLGIPERQGQAVHDEVVTHLHDRPWLLVLDNFEQVVTAAPAVTDLLGACPRLTVLVTSRAPLRVHGEQIFLVSPLGFPVETHSATTKDLEQYPALALFAQRARAVRPDILLPAPIIAAICQHLDGLHKMGRFIPCDVSRG